MENFVIERKNGFDFSSVKNQDQPESSQGSVHLRSSRLPDDPVRKRFIHDSGQSDVRQRRHPAGRTWSGQKDQYAFAQHRAGRFSGCAPADRV